MTASAPTYSLLEAKDSIGFPQSVLHGTKQGEHLVCPCGRWAVTKNDERFEA